MSEIINFQDYLSIDDSQSLTERMLKDSQHNLALNNQKLSSDLINLENQNITMAVLQHQVRELQIENDTLLNALEVGDIDELPALLTDVITHGNKQDIASQSMYWEREYSQLKDKIRSLEHALAEKDDALKQAIHQNEQLLNELLAK